jgi:predicted permease
VSLFWRRRRREAELEEEIRGHLEMAARDREARGESPTEAAYAARREFGNATLVKEVTRRMWGGVWLDRIVQDLRLAVRTLRRSPGFVVVAVLALGLGLGLSTTMFAVIDAAMNPRPAYANADRLFMVNPRMSTRAGRMATRAELFQLIRDRVPALDAVLPIGVSRDPIQVGSEERDEVELVVPADWFGVVGIRPALGRAFAAADGDRVAVLSHEVWRRALAGRRSLSGAQVSIGDRSYSVIGVLPREARGIAAVLPLPPGEAGLRLALSMPLVRLRPDASRLEVGRQLQALASLLTATYATAGNPWGLPLFPWREGQNREEMDGLHLVMVAAALAVLLIACVNLAHLMLARGLAKRRELAVRMALGVGRAGAAQVVLAEGTIIAGAGVGLGAVVGIWGSKVLESAMPYEVSWIGYIQAQLSWRVFVLGAVAAVASAVLFGLLPALRVAFAVQITEPLKDEAGATTGGARRRYSPLVILEVALALALLMGGTLLLRSVHRLRTAPTGFDAETLVNAEVAGMWSWRPAPGGGRDTTTSVEWEQVLATVRAAPGILGAALQGLSRAPGAALTAEMGGDSTRTITTQSYPVVSSEYLRVHGLLILQGRDFEPGDATGNGVAILSSAAAVRLYPRGDAVGRMLKLGGPATAAPWVSIVGVARTPLLHWGEKADIGSAAGLPDELPVWIVQRPGKWYHAFVLARAATRDPNALVRLRRALRSVPGVLVSRVHPYTSVRDASIAYFDFLSKVFVALGAVGLSLAALGVYGVLAYAVSRRMREFGIRVALGADPSVLFRMVMHDGVVMLLAGTGVGAFGALAAAPLFSSMSVGVYPTDAVSLVAAEALLLVVGLAATLAPALRAVRASPLDIIRAV